MCPCSDSKRVDEEQMKYNNKRGIAIKVVTSHSEIIEVINLEVIEWVTTVNEVKWMCNCGLMNSEQRWEKQVGKKSGKMYDDKYHVVYRIYSVLLNRKERDHA